VYPGTVRYMNQRQGWKPFKNLECGDALF